MLDQLPFEVDVQNQGSKYLYVSLFGAYKHIYSIPHA